MKQKRRKTNKKQQKQKNKEQQKKQEKQKKNKKNKKTTKTKYKNQKKNKKRNKKKMGAVNRQPWYPGMRGSGWVSSSEKLVSKHPPCSAEEAPGARFGATERHAERVPQQQSMEKTAPGCSKAPFPECCIPRAGRWGRRSSSQGVLPPLFPRFRRCFCAAGAKTSPTPRKWWW